MHHYDEAAGKAGRPHTPPFPFGVDSTVEAVHLPHKKPETKASVDSTRAPNPIASRFWKSAESHAQWHSRMAGGGGAEKVVV